MAGLPALISSVINLVNNSLHEIENIYFAPSSSSSAQAPDKHVLEADLKRLMRMLERIRVTLYDAEERYVRDKSVKLWLTELRELGHEAEFVLDEYMYEVYSAQLEARNNDLKLQKKRKPSDQSCAYYVKVPDGMADRIRSIASRFEEIAKDRKALRLREDEAQRRPYNKMQDKPTSPVVVEESIFGRGVEKEEVIDLLFSVYNQRKSILVLPIVGKGGLGKTTLAQLVYNDKRIRERFDMFGWVYVSDDFNIERIVRDIIESFTRTGCNLRNPSVLLEELASKINGKRIFLVLDDVWNDKPGLWDLLCNHLMKAKAVNILVTTRNVSVARIMQTMDPLHLSYLPDDKCWSLFMYYAFQGIEPAKQSGFVKIGKEIVKKCGGLPLGIKSIASLLNHEADEHSWMEILESDLWELDAGKEILASLQISYERLPVYLKPCLVLCSMFPKDYRYDMELVTRLWIVNGYIEPKENKNPEEVAVDYAKELHGRSFFDDFNTEPIDCHENWCPNSITEKRSFRLHDMVHDLAWLNSENTCYSVERGTSNQICHLYISDEWRLRGSLDFIVSMNIPVLQTLVMQSPPFSFDVKDTKPISFTFLSKAECLRALHLGDAEVQPLPLWHPKHLRYLFCYATQISPQFLFSAYNLRILILRFGKNTTEMELEGIGNLLNLDLLRLHINHFDIKLPESFGFLSKLRY